MNLKVTANLDLRVLTMIELESLVSQAQVELDRRKSELPPLDEEERSLAAAGDTMSRIKAIRSYRMRIGPASTLRQAKDLVDLAAEEAARRTR